jgi:hypothetical protein
MSVIPTTRAASTSRSTEHLDILMVRACISGMGGAYHLAAQLPSTSFVVLEAWIDPENFNPGYMMRNMHPLPKRGDKPEWQHSQDCWAEKDEFPAIDLDDAAFVYD